MDFCFFSATDSTTMRSILNLFCALSANPRILSANDVFLEPFEGNVVYQIRIGYFGGPITPNLRIKKESFCQFITADSFFSNQNQYSRKKDQKLLTKCCDNYWLSFFFKKKGVLEDRNIFSNLLQNSLTLNLLNFEKRRTRNIYIFCSLKSLKLLQIKPLPLIPLIY